MRHFLQPVQVPNVVQVFEIRRKPPVQTEHLFVDDGRQGQEIEQVGDVLPNVQIAEFAEAFVVESVGLG